jgi:hypothetical protein
MDYKTDHLWNDIENQPDFTRKDMMVKTGIKSILEFPFFFDNELIGVLQLDKKQEY